jgi:hypothetical protein
MKNTATAAETYAARRNDIARLMDLLQMELDRDAADQKADPKNWGFPGNLDKVRNDLVELVSFMSSKIPADVEAFLADAE